MDMPHKPSRNELHTIDVLIVVIITQVPMLIHSLHYSTDGSSVVAGWVRSERGSEGITGKIAPLSSCTTICYLSSPCPLGRVGV